jgi:hypothetical protein
MNGGTTRVVPLYFAQCYIRSVMGIRSAYRRVPSYVAAPLALLASAFVALALAFLASDPLDLLLEKLFHRPGSLGISLLVEFCAVPSIAVLAFVSFFTILISWHHVSSWRTPTFAFALSAILVWVWAHDFGGIGFAWYIPGTIAWLLCCWLRQRSASAHSEHAIEA